MGGSLSRLKRIRENACRHSVAKAGGESSEALREPILHGATPEKLIYYPLFYSVCPANGSRRMIDSSLPGPTEMIEKGTCVISSMVLR